MMQYKMANTVLIAVPMFFLASFSAWAEPEPVSETASTTPAEEIAPAVANETAEAAEAKGLDMAVDGSSLEAFEKSLAKIKETCTEAEYQSLEGSLDYLMIYDLGAKRDREKLAARLDGSTGYEIIKMVKWRKP